MVAGLEGITEGEIRIDGGRVNELEPADRNIAMVFQNYALYPHMSVFGNMAYGLRNRGMARAAIREKVAEAARFLQLEGLLDRRPNQLSGGQRQRVAIARALATRPRLVLADEPTANLDQATGREILDLMQAINRETGTTFIFSTHDSQVMAIADRLLHMVDGRFVDAPAAEAAT